MPEKTVIDLFCGIGGFSEGFKKENYNILLGVDHDNNSINTYKSNHQNSEYLKEDISTLSSDDLMSNLDTKIDDIDIIIGGPPCQGFSIAGNRNEEDERNELFKEFARHINNIKPEVFVMENVTGLLSMNTPSNEPVIDKIQDKFLNIGYNTDYKVLKASDYGVPQNRKRVFIIGSKNHQDISFPKPTHSESNNDLKNYLNVKDAISDLPSLDPGEQKETYNKKPKNEYQSEMRENILGNQNLTNHHAVNHRDHIVERFKHIPQGGDMTDAPEEHQPSKVYSSRNRRLPESKPSYTVTSHVLDELIHPWDNRAITVREAARLQSFPDHYEFKGKRNVFHGDDETSQYEQIGNAVPPKLSQSIAKYISNNYFN